MTFQGSSIRPPSDDLCTDNKPNRCSSSNERNLWGWKLLPLLDFSCCTLQYFGRLWLWDGSVQVGMHFQLISLLCGAQSDVQIHHNSANYPPGYFGWYKHVW